jgi:hypothetical protein
MFSELGFSVQTEVESDRILSETMEYIATKQSGNIEVVTIEGVFNDVDNKSKEGVVVVTSKEIILPKRKKF